MGTGADYYLHLGIRNVQPGLQKACETEIENFRSKHGDGPYTLGMCLRVIQAGYEYGKSNTALALAGRGYSPEGIEHYLEEEGVSSFRVLDCR